MSKTIETKKNSALFFIKEVMTEVTTIKPSAQEMLRDIKMMDFKVRPVSGDLFALAMKQTGLLEQLWRIGKIEEIVRRAIMSLNSHERGLFFNYIDTLEKQMHEETSKEMQRIQRHDGKDHQMVTLEIFKEAKRQKKAN